MNPLISIIMPVYNAEIFIKHSLESILSQSYKNFELIIINDNSSDNSVNIIKKYDDDRIIILNNSENIGISKSLNIGILKAKGDYISRMDADDIIYKNKIKEQIRYIIKKDLDFCGTWIRFFGNENKTIKYPSLNQDIRFFMYFGSPFAHPSVIFRKSLVKYNVYKNCFAEDFDLWVRIAADKKVKFGNLPKVLLKYRTHKNQISFNKKNIINDSINICKRHTQAFITNETHLSLLNNLNYGMNNKYEINETKKLIRTIFEIGEKELISNKIKNRLILSFLNRTKKLNFSHFFSILFTYYKYNYVSIKFFIIFSVIFFRQYIR